MRGDGCAARARGGGCYTESSEVCQAAAPLWLPYNDRISRPLHSAEDRIYACRAAHLHIRAAAALELVEGVHNQLGAPLHALRWEAAGEGSKIYHRQQPSRGGVQHLGLCSAGGKPSVEPSAAATAHLQNPSPLLCLQLMTQLSSL